MPLSRSDEASGSKFALCQQNIIRILIFILSITDSQSLDAGMRRIFDICPRPNVTYETTVQALMVALCCEHIVIAHGYQPGDMAREP